MKEQSGLSRLLQSIGIDLDTQNELSKEICEAEESLNTLGNNILGNIADTIEAGKPLAKDAFELASETADKASNLLISTMDDILETFCSDEEQHMGFKRSYDSCSKVSRPNDEAKLIQDITAGLDYILNSMKGNSINHRSIESITTVVIVTKQMLKNSNEPFEVLMRKVLVALDSIDTSLNTLSTNILVKFYAIIDLQNSVRHIRMMVKDALKEREIPFTNLMEEFVNLLDNLKIEISDFERERLLKKKPEESESVSGNKSPKEESSQTDKIPRNEEESHKQEDNSEESSSQKVTSPDEEDSIINDVKDFFNDAIVEDLESASNSLAYKLGQMLEELGKEIQDKSGKQRKK